MSSSTKILRVRYTKIELIRLKRRLVVARKIHKILRERLTILISELYSMLKEATECRRRIHKTLTEIYTSLIKAYTVMSDNEIDILTQGIPPYHKLYIATKNIMGVITPLLEVRREKTRATYTLAETCTPLQDIARRMSDLIEDIATLAELEKSIQLLSYEVIRTKRRVNALEHILIPRIEATIRFLTMMFEEREREEKARLKHVKTVLTRRRAGE